MKTERAYKYVKTRIINGVLASGESIDVSKVTAALNISRTPVNKALRRLEQEGYISIVPQVGVFVKQLDPQEVYEKMLVSAHIDSLMASIAAEKIGEEDLTRLEDILKQMEDPSLTPEEYKEYNIRYHQVIYEAADLKHIMNMAKDLWDYLHYVGRSLSLFTGESRTQSMIEHWLIYYSLKDRDSVLVREVTEKHLKRVMKQVMKGLTITEKEEVF